MSKHTPGPWQVNHRDAAQVCDADGEKRGCAPIAHCVGTAAEYRANARLIAAAPELLAALQVAREFMSIASDWNVDEAEINGEMRSTYDLIADVDAAIAKATGGTQ